MFQNLVISLSCCYFFFLFFRRDTKPVDSHLFGSPLFASRKRVAIPESTKTTDENFNKKSKVISHSDSSEMLPSQTPVQKDSVVQKRKNRDSGTEITNVSAAMSSFLLTVIKLFHLSTLKKYRYICIKFDNITLIKKV